MTIDELLRAWKAQDAKPRYVIDYSELQTVLEERSRSLRQVLYSDEIKNYWTGLWIVGFLVLWFWAGPGESQSSLPYFLTLAVAAAAVLYYFAYSFFFVAQRRPRVPETRFTFSLRERLQLEMEYLTHQITARTRWYWVASHFVPPWLACMAVVWISSFRNDGAHQWNEILGLIVVTGGWIHMHLLERRWVLRELAPRRRELEALYRELIEGETD